MFLFVVCRHVQCTPVGRTCRRADETKGTYNYGTHARFSFHFLFDGSVTVTGRPRQSRISSGLYLSSSKSRSIVHEWRSVRSVASACLRVRCVPWVCVDRLPARAPMGVYHTTRRANGIKQITHTLSVLPLWFTCLISNNAWPLDWSMTWP